MVIVVQDTAPVLSGKLTGVPVFVSAWQQPVEQTSPNRRTHPDVQSAFYRDPELKHARCIPCLGLSLQAGKAAARDEQPHSFFSCIFSHARSPHENGGEDYR